MTSGIDTSGLSDQGPPITTTASNVRTEVDDYWGQVTVNSTPFKTALESVDYLQWRSSIYPLFAQYMELYGDHAGEVVLDYGCGPGNDTVGFLLFSNANKVIGMDVSEKALRLASHRIGLHAIDPARVDLIRTSDASTHIPLDSETVDYINCGGVLHHVSHPELVLQEFARVLRPGGRGSIMVYNRQSIFFHLWIAYQRQLMNGDFPGLDAQAAFSKATDGEQCPISIAYRPEDFARMGRRAGLEVEFVGGYFAAMELDLMRSAGKEAMADSRLGEEHRQFLRELTPDENGDFRYRGRTAGHGGVYSIRKTS